MADEKKSLNTILDETIKKRDELNVIINFLQQQLGGEGRDVSPAPGVKKIGGNPLDKRDAADPISIVYPGMFFGKSQSQAVKMLLEQVHRPLKTRMILDCLEKGGKASGGKNPTTNLWTTLKRNNDTFIMVPKAGWGLCEWYDEGVIARYRKEGGKENGGKETAASDVEPGSDP